MPTGASDASGVRRTSGIGDGRGKHQYLCQVEKYEDAQAVIALDSGARRVADTELAVWRSMLYPGTAERGTRWN